MSRIDFQTLRDGRVAVITINRPEAHNALDKDAQDGLHAAFDRFAADDGLWVAILTGAGSAAFCAGHDLKSPAPEGPADLPTSGFGGVTARFDLDKPVIAAEGHDLGFVTEVVAPDAVMEAALRWADALLAVSPLAARAAKQVVQQLAALPLAQASALQWTLPAVQTMQTSADRGEGMAAFVDRRPPVWSGR